MYVINNFQLISIASDVFLNHYGKGAKISNPHLAKLLEELKSYKKLEISEKQLADLSEKYNIGIEPLKKLLAGQLNIIKPLSSRKFQKIYINSDCETVASLLKQTLTNEYHIEKVAPSYKDYVPNSLIICYRKNYSHPDFKALYENLPEKTYLITAGVIHKLLVIDNIYYKNSGLPSHFSNLHQLTAYLKSDITATKNNWLLFYRELFKHQIETFPEPEINACQSGYIAYCLCQFASQYTNLWQTPTPMDQLNWLWHVDLTNFSVHTEVAMHSPFSEFDMKLNLNYQPDMEAV